MPFEMGFLLRFSIEGFLRIFEVIVEKIDHTSIKLAVILKIGEETETNSWGSRNLIAFSLERDRFFEACVFCSIV